MCKSESYIKLYEMRYDARVSANAKLLYGEIALLCQNDKGYCWATNEYFAKLYGTSSSSIKRWLNELVKYYYIRQELTRKGYKTLRKIWLTNTDAYSSKMDSNDSSPNMNHYIAGQKCSEHNSNMSCAKGANMDHKDNNKKNNNNNKEQDDNAQAPHGFVVVDDGTKVPSSVKMTEAGGNAHERKVVPFPNVTGEGKKTDENFYTAERLRSYGINGSMVQKLLQKYSIADINRDCDYADKYIQSKYNPAGFVCSAITGAWGQVADNVTGLNSVVTHPACQNEIEEDNEKWLKIYRKRLHDEAITNGEEPLWDENGEAFEGEEGK